MRMKKELSLNRAIDFKEWLKMRWAILGGLLLMLGMSGYVLLRMQRIIHFKGVNHLWEIMLIKDVTFLEPLTYIPLLLGIVFAAIQFIPEMEQKRLKLTLHLPYPVTGMLFRMVRFGVTAMLLITLVSLILLSVRLHQLFAIEFTIRMILTTLPWFMGGICAYLFGAWIIIEPTWKGRFINTLFAVLWLWIFYLPVQPESGNSMLIYYPILLVLAFVLIFRSMYRFKTGKQD